MKKLLFYSLIVLLLASGARVSVAATSPEYTLLEPLPCVPTTGHPCTTPDATIKTFTINQFIEYVFKFSIALAVLLAVIMVIWGGFQYMTSEIPFDKTNAKEKFRNAGIGLAGALASFLILQTIDPRLVQINTQIEPICPEGSTSPICNKNALDSFNKQLSDDLKALTAEKQNEINALQDIRNQIEKQKQDLLTQLYNGDISEDEYTVEIEKLNGKAADANIKQQKIIADGFGTVNFRVALDEINTNRATNLEQYTTDPIADVKQNGKFPTNSPNVIQNRYNQKINDILAISPQNEESSQTLKILSLEKNFYIKQIREEAKLQILYNYVDANSSSALAELQMKQNEYRKNLRFPERQESSGAPVEEYNKIMQTRINKIDSVLKTAGNK